MSWIGQLRNAGISSNGNDVEIFRGKLYAQNIFSAYGNVWYVDTARSTGGNGRSWGSACKTVSDAVAKASAGDIIFIKAAALNEAVEVTVAGLTLLGVGPTTNRALWTAPDTTDPALLFTAAPDFLVSGFRFRPPVANAAISLVDVSHNGLIADCRFQGKAGSYYGIQSDGKQANVRIERNDFFYLNTLTYGTAIYGVHGATSDNSGWLIKGNRFHSNLRHIVCPMRQAIIDDNILPAGGLEAAGSMNATMTLLGIDIHGAATGYNIVTRNQLGGLYHQAHYYGGTGDEWVGNFCVDRSHATQVDATTGISILPPAA
jgi:hypothetical protein